VNWPYLRTRFVLPGILLISATVLAVAEGGIKFAPDDPVWVDPDRMPIPQPRRVQLSKAYDLLENSFGHPGRDGGPSSNVNTLGEVPDSSWFTNRITAGNRTARDVVQRAERPRGPDTSGPWLVTSLKTEGITPGVSIRDPRNDRYILKFDPPGLRQMATSAEIISTEFFHAFGYNVPDNSLVFFEPGRLRIAPDATIREPGGRERSLEEADLHSVMKRVPKGPDGRIQALASLLIPGKLLGPFKYYGTRSDDPNDVFPHEDRRELRALRIFDAWLNHNDSDAVNTLDTFTGDGGFVRHYLIDFGTTLGSGAFEPKARRAGNEYYIEPMPMLLSAVTLGIYDRGWRSIAYPKYPSIGRFEAAHFDPAAWKPDYPNPAHEKLQRADALWAIRSLMRFDEEAIRQVVALGQYENQEAAQYLVRVLAERRDRLVHYHLGRTNPLDGFRVSEDRTALGFRDLGAEAGLQAGDRVFEYQWFSFDNPTQETKPMTEARSVSSASLLIPRSDAGYLKVRIRTVARDYPDWRSFVDVYLRNNGDLTVVGIERES
jgi:hypothetical protein